MVWSDLGRIGTRDLLKTHAGILEELRKRKVLRSTNGPAGDYAEYLFCRAFPWKQQPNSSTGYDAVDASGVRYQIKGRRPTVTNRSRELSVLRRLDEDVFEFLAAVLFALDYGVQRAALIPVEIVRAQAARSDHVNGWRFHLSDSVWEIPGVTDVTAASKTAEDGI
jgi:hypothetical protein